MSKRDHIESDAKIAKRLAAMFAPSDANYVFVCLECRTSWWRQRDCKTTRGVRSGKTTCGACDSELIMAVDKKQ